MITHRPDLPITLGNSTRIGLGLWNFPVIAVASEILVFALGLWIYTHHTRALDRRGSIGFWALALFLLAVYAASLLGPPPPSGTAVAWSAQALWLVVAWGLWVDHHRARKSDG